MLKGLGKLKYILYTTLSIIGRTNILSRILTICCMLGCSFMLLSHLIFSFQDIGLELENILVKAKKASLIPIQRDIPALQKSMFNKLKVTPDKILLGKILYFDPRLSRDGKYSCNSCHNISLQGTSMIRDSRGIYPPSVYNMIFNEVAYLDGSISAEDRLDKNTSNFPSKNVTARATLKALVAHNEMNADISNIILMLSNSDEYMAYFKRAYGSKVKVSEHLIAQSIALFIMTLNTQTRYDDFLDGNLKALSIQEARGMEIFIDKGCVACHSGVNLGGTMQPFEVMREYKFADTNHVITGDDKMLKVPSLRNVVQKARYFHNGGATKLEDAVKEMADMQLGVKLSSSEIDQIIEFFNTLNGKPEDIILPILPHVELSK